MFGLDPLRSTIAGNPIARDLNAMKGLLLSRKRALSVDVALETLKVSKRSIGVYFSRLCVSRAAVQQSG